MSLSIFGFKALWSPYFLGFLLVIIVLYFLVTVTWRSKFKESEPLKRSESIYFILAMVTLYIIKGSPIDLLGHILFAVHMGQMAFLLLLAPIFFIKGIPLWVWKALLKIKPINTVFKMLSQPILSIFLFIGMFSFYHLPIIFDAIKLNIMYHAIYTTLLFIAGIFMYWPLMNKVEGQPKMRNILKLAYIAGNAILITPACALIIFASDPLYATFYDSSSWLKAMELCVPVDVLANLSLSGPELFTSMTPVSDQQVGGVLMKIVQEIIFGIILFKVFRDWWNNERKNEKEITENALKEFQDRTLY